ncbi:MAG: AAA family ATPase, partial [Mixta sp.]
SNLIYYIAPLIAILGMTKSFLGICLSVAETFTTLTGEVIGAKSESGWKKAKVIAFLIMFAVSFAVVYVNPDVITLIETVCGPLIAIFLFLIPAWLIYTRKELQTLRGLTAIVVLLGGLLTVSALLYGMFF